jgi:formyl-CoA transferase
VPVASVNTIPELASEPQVHALDMIRPVPGADFVLAGLPLSFNGARPEVKLAAPRLGADNDRYLRGSPPPKASR